MTPKDTLIHILEAIGYNGDKDAFATLFLNLTYRQAIINLIQNLTQDTQEKLMHDLSVNAGDPLRLSNEVSKILVMYFSDVEKKQALELVAKKSISEWIQAIVPLLSDEQKNKLAALVSGTSVASPAASAPQKPSVPGTTPLPPIIDQGNAV